MLSVAMEMIKWGAGKYGPLEYSLPIFVSESGMRTGNGF